MGALTAVSGAIVVISSAITGICAIINTVIGLGVIPSAVNTGKQLFDGAVVDSFNKFDLSFSKMTVNLGNLMYNIYSYSCTILIVSAFLFLIFSAFKLWLGTIEIKKMFAESIMKFVVVTVAMLTFPYICAEVLNLSTQLGVEISGGSTTLVSSVANLAKQTSAISQATKDVKNILSTNINENNYKNWNIDANVIYAFTSAGMTKEEALQWAADNNIGVVMDWDNSSTNSKWSVNNVRDIIDRDATFEFDWQRKQYEREVAVFDAITGDNFDTLKQQIEMIHALSEILTGYDALNLDGLSDEEKKLVPTFNNLLNNADAVINYIFSGVFIPNTSTLSAGNLMYMALVTSEMISRGTLSYLNEGVDTDTTRSSWVNLFENKDKTVLIKFLNWLLKSFVYKFGIILSMIIVMSEYYLCIIEYLIVVSLSTLIIPLYFIDATKQFAAGIIKTLFSYFIKLLVTSFMCFFIMSFYLDMASDLVASTNIASTSNFVYFLFILIIGLTLAKSSGRIASAVISGNPTIGSGDLANEFRSLNGAFRATAGELHKYLDTASKAGKYGTEKGQHGVEIGKAGMDAQALARQKANDTFDDMRKNTPGFTMSEAEQKREVDKIASKAGRDFWKQALENKGYKMLHGHGAAGAEIGEDGNLHAKGYAMPGTQYWDKDKEHFVDVNSQNAKYYNKGSDAAKKAEEIAKMYTSTPNSGTGTKSEQHINPGRDDFPDEDTSAHD